MKAVPFKRKLKHLKKKFQRENKNSYETRKELNLFMADYGAYCDYSSDLEVILRFKDADSRRFKKLLIRLGKAAKKKNSIVRVYDLISLIKYGYVYDPSSLRNRYSDARQIPFYKLFKIIKQSVCEKVTLGISKESAENNFGFSHNPIEVEFQTTELNIEEYKKIL